MIFQRVFLFCVFVIFPSVVVYANEPDGLEVLSETLTLMALNQQSQILLLERQLEVFQELDLIYQYQLGMLSFLSGVISSFVFLYGLRLR
jgi:hypothetical protein